MPGNVNKVFLMGNLTRDPEHKALAGGQSVTEFGLAVNERYKDKTGEWQERANFFDLTAWGNRGEAIGKYLGKGDPIFVEGRLRFEQWQDKDGNNRSKVRVTVDDFQFVGGGKGGDGGRDAQPRSSKPKAATNYHDDEIPF